MTACTAMLRSPDQELSGLISVVKALHSCTESHTKSTHFALKLMISNDPPMNRHFTVDTRQCHGDYGQSRTGSATISWRF